MDVLVRLSLLEVLTFYQVRD